MIDLHCHILPGLDDGPSDLESAIVLARLAVSCGITTIVATPHHLPGLYPTTTEAVLEKVSRLTAEMRAREIPLQILSGQEIHIEPETVEKLSSRSLLTINSTNYFLLELPFSQIPHGTREIIFGAKVSGFTPIICHPERNAQIQQNSEILADFVRSGALVQINGASIMGRYGEQPQKAAKELLQKKLVNVIASDAHKGDALMRDFLQSFDYISSFYSGEIADKLTRVNPEAIIHGRKVEVEFS